MKITVPEHTIEFLRSIKKSIIVLFAMGLLKRPTGPVELAELLEMDRKPVSKYLKELMAVGLVGDYGGRAGWFLTSSGQLFLSWAAEVIPDYGDLIPANGDKIPQLGHNGDLIPIMAPTTTTKLINPLNKVKDSNSSLHNGDFIPANGDKIPQPNPVIIDILKGRGIGKAMLNKLAAMPHVTPDYAKAHARQYDLDRSKNPGVKVGLLITRIRDQDDAPALPGDDEQDKYTGGDLSEFIIK